MQFIVNTMQFIVNVVQVVHIVIPTTVGRPFYTVLPLTIDNLKIRFGNAHYCHLTGNIDLNLSFNSMPNIGFGLALSLVNGWAEGHMRRGLVTQRAG
jgi:hypothetical protein